MIDTTNQENIFSTRDLTLAAVLVTLKFGIVSIDFMIDGVKSQPVGYFCFEESESLRDARRKYSQSMLMVEPKLYQSNLHSLKAEVVNMYKNPHTAIFK